MSVLHMREEIRVFDHIKRGVLLLIIVLFLVLLAIHLTSSRLTLSTQKLEAIAGGSLVVEGSASAESTIQILAGSQRLGTTETNDDGHWRLTIDIPNEAGIYDLRVLSTTETGVVNKQLKFSDKLHVRPLTAASNFMQPSLDNMTIEAGNPPWVTLSGKSAIDSRLMLRLNDEPLGIVRTDKEGQWSFSSSSFKTEGEHLIVIEALSSVGVSVPGTAITETIRLDAASIQSPSQIKTNAQSSEPTAVAEPAEAVVAEPTEEPAPVTVVPTIDEIVTLGGFQQPLMGLSGSGASLTNAQLMLNGVEHAEIAIDDDGMWSWEGVVMDYAAQTWTIIGADEETAKQTFTPEKPSVITPTLTFDGDTVSGTGTPESLILLTLDEVDLAAVKVDVEGTWVSESLELGSGSHLLVVTALDVDGEPAASAELKLSTAVPTHIIHVLGGNQSYQVTGSAAPSTTIQLQLNGDELAVVETDENGAWVWGGSHRDAAVLAYVAIGEDDIESQHFLFKNADISNVDDILLDHDDLEQGVQISGTAPPNHQLQLLVDNVVWDVVESDANGLWAWQARLPEFGTHSFVAQVISAENNIIDSTAPISFIRHANPTIDVDAFLLDAADGDVELEGSGTYGGLVSVVIDGKVRKNAIVSEDGQWTWEGGIEEPGSHTLQLNVLTEYGAMILLGEPLTFTRD